MAGAMAAQACAAAGMKVILLEAGRIGQGGSGRATGLISSEACGSYRDLEERAGKRAARALFSHTEKAPRELAAAVKRLGIKAGLELKDAVRALPEGGSESYCNVSWRRARKPV